MTYAVPKAAVTPSKPFATRFTNVLSHYDHLLNVTSFLVAFFDVSYNSLIQEQQWQECYIFSCQSVSIHFLIYTANMTNTVILKETDIMILMDLHKCRTFTALLHVGKGFTMLSVYGCLYECAHCYSLNG
jgi:hypothetical protein